MSFTYEEIKEQYNTLKKTSQYLSDRKENIIGFFGEKKPETLIFIGSGSSYMISKSLEFIAEIKLGIHSISIPAGDLMLHFERYSKLLGNAVVFTVSRSGSTTEVINAVNNMKSIADVSVISLVCTENSEISKISDLSLEIPWAFDESVCQTRTVTNLYAAALQIIGMLADDSALEEDLKTVIERGNAYIEEYEPRLKEIAESDFKDVVVLADGEISGISEEAALAYKEISCTPSDFYHLLDSRHGPIVMIGKETLAVIAITKNGYDYQAALVKDMVKTGAKVIVYSASPIEKIEGVLLQVTSETALDPSVSGIPFVNISQIIAFYKAMQKGIDPDAPDGLNAWIKL